MRFVRRFRRARDSVEHLSCLQSARGTCIAARATMEKNPRKSAHFYLIMLGLAALGMAIGAALGAFDAWFI